MAGLILAFVFDLCAISVFPISVTYVVSATVVFFGITLLLPAASGILNPLLMVVSFGCNIYFHGIFSYFSLVFIIYIVFSVLRIYQIRKKLKEAKASADS